MTLQKLDNATLMNKNSTTQAVIALKQGGIIAYPTEAVFGLGCDPFNEIAVHKLLALKNRGVKKGLILIVATWEQARLLIQEDTLAHLPPSTTQPTTWVFPASKQAPSWICGEHPTIALRVVQHPIAQQLCLDFGGPIVSTSANLEGQTPARTKDKVLAQFPRGIEVIIDGATGGCENPSVIKNALTGKILRE